MTDNSSQTFRNVYERFYNEFRRYLWPYSVLVNLADLECDIYSAFLNLPKLKTDFARLNSVTRQIRSDDVAFGKVYRELENLINETTSNSYMLINRVAEINPQNSKILNLANNEEEENVEEINDEDIKEVH